MNMVEEKHNKKISENHFKKQNIIPSPENNLKFNFKNSEKLKIEINEKKEK